MRREIWTAASTALSTIAVLAALEGCNKTDGRYKGNGYCVGGPEGLVAAPEPDPHIVVYKKDGAPKPIQDLAVKMIDSPDSPETLKSSRNFAITGTYPGGTVNPARKVLENVDLLGGKGYFVLVELPGNLMASSMVIGKSHTFGCDVNIDIKDRETLKDLVQACKTLRPAD